MYSRASVVGRAGRQAEQKYLPDGKAVTTMSVATDVGYGDKKKTVWYRVVTFGKLAETCGQYVEKGRLLAIDGVIQPVEVYQKRDGSWGASLTLIADTVRFLDKGSGEQAGAQSTDDVSDVPF
jgi:single-strand DNA-binding protein